MEFQIMSNVPSQPGGLVARKPRSLSRRIILFLAVLAAWMSAAFFGFEAWFRAHSTRVIATGATNGGRFIATDPELLIRYTPRGRRLVPGAQVRILNHRLSGLDIEMQVNSRGFRDRELAAHKTPNEFRALVLGDSITWGDYLPAEAVYVERAEQLLNPAPDGRRVELINAGVGDVGIREEMFILEESGLATEPDLVVLGFYLNDSRPPWGFAGELGRPGWLRRHSAFADHVHRAYQLQRWFKEEGEHRSAWIPAMGEVPWRENCEAFERLARMARFDWGAAWQPESWTSVSQELTRLRRHADRRGFRVLVVAFPVRFQVEANFVDDRPQRTLEELARANGFGFLDLLPLLRSHRGETIYFDHCHPVATANAWIGDTLAQRLRAEYLAPQSPGAHRTEVQ